MTIPVKDRARVACRSNASMSFVAAAASNAVIVVPFEKHEQFLSRYFQDTNEDRCWSAAATRERAP